MPRIGFENFLSPKGAGFGRGRLKLSWPPFFGEAKLGCGSVCACQGGSQVPDMCISAHGPQIPSLLCSSVLEILESDLVWREPGSRVRTGPEVPRVAAGAGLHPAPADQHHMCANRPLAPAGPWPASPPLPQAARQGEEPISNL